MRIRRGSRQSLLYENRILGAAQQEINIFSVSSMILAVENKEDIASAIPFCLYHKRACTRKTQYVNEAFHSVKAIISVYMTRYGRSGADLISTALIFYTLMWK